MRNHKLAPMASSSSKNTNKPEQPHLSGAYIRSLVKQLSSTSTARSRDHNSTMGSSKPHGQLPEDHHHPQAAHQIAPPPQQQPPPHKKQVRRRLHTSRPYQEKLLNMAEARREIVTALKIHRASMRQAKEQQQQQQMVQLHLQQQQEIHHAVVQDQAAAANRASAAEPVMSYSDYYLYNNSSFAHFTPAPSSYSSPPLTSLYHTPSVVTPMVSSDHHHDFGGHHHHLVPLPPQTLGLNLSFQGFSSADNNADTAKNTTCSFDPPLLQQPSPTSSYSVYSSPSVTMASNNNDLSSSAVTATADNTSSLSADHASLHRVLDDEEMAAIYSIGEQHDIEWSDTVNLVTSAWWSKLLESIEGKGDDGAVVVEQAAAAAAGSSANTNTTAAEDPVVDTPPPDWFNDSSLGQQATHGSNSDVLVGMHLNDYYHHNNDVTLPQMDIGEFEGWEAEWFS